MTTLDTNRPAQFAKRTLFAAGLLFALEMLVIGTVFKHAINFDCLANWPQYACWGASGTMVAAYCALGTLVLLMMLRPQPFQDLCAEAGGHRAPLGLNLAGAALALFPVFLLSEGSNTAAIIPSFICWSVGMLAMLTGLALFIAPAARWRKFLSEQWKILLPVIATGLIAPSFAALLRPMWRIDTVADATFRAVAWIVDGFGYDLFVSAEQKVIGAGDFHINVDPQCSGIEGIALVTLFVTLFLVVFRADLRFPRAFLLYPIGIVASAIFNVVRITLLLIIGLEGNPELAIDGFHSHAGWLMFTLVALGIIALAQTVPALRKQTVADTASLPPLLPLRQDPTVAAILPFAVFMISALLASAFSQTPGLIYPARVVLMLGVLAIFWGIYLRLPWRLDPIAMAAGGLIGLGWIMIPVDAGDAVAPYGTLTGILLVGWFILRGVGTAVLVPLIEELFFRGYLEKRLRLGTGRLWVVMAAIGTAVLFAALHDRWVEAFFAGLIFSWVARRRDNICDAIVAHAAANLLIFMVAVATNQIHII